MWHFHDMDVYRSVVKPKCRHQNSVSCLCSATKKRQILCHTARAQHVEHSMVKDTKKPSKGKLLPPKHSEMLMFH